MPTSNRRALAPVTNFGAPDYLQGRNLNTLRTRDCCGSALQTWRNDEIEDRGEGCC